jgi:hypothetical protein
MALVRPVRCRLSTQHLEHYEYELKLKIAGCRHLVKSNTWSQPTRQPASGIRFPPTNLTGNVSDRIGRNCRRIGVGIDCFQYFFGRVSIIAAPHTLRQITAAAGLTGFVCRPGRHCRRDKTKASSGQQQIAHGLFLPWFVGYACACAVTVTRYRGLLETSATASRAGAARHQ